MPKRRSANFTRQRKRARRSGISDAHLELNIDAEEQEDANSEEDLAAPVAKIRRERPRVQSKKVAEPPSQDAEQKQQQEEADSENDELTLPINYPKLQARERYINHDVVKKKWEKLSDSAQEQVRNLFLSLNSPFLSVLRDEKRRVEAQIVLDQVVKTLSRRLPRMPFPPSTRDWHFDHEAILRSNRALEQQLTPALHSTALLKAEIAREQERLEADIADLAELEKNAEAEKKLLRRHGAKRHNLLEMTAGVDKNEKRSDEVEDICLAPEYESKVSERTAGTEVVNLDDDELEPQLKPLVAQLENHLDSIEGNMKQVEGVEEAVTRSATNLHALLLGRMSGDRFKLLPVL